MRDDLIWLKNCIDDPERFKIYIDNDELFVVEISKEGNEEFEEGVVYTFSNYGQDFNVFVLEYLGANVDYV